jgi:nucleoid-associated protein YgaU
MPLNPWTPTSPTLKHEIEVDQNSASNANATTANATTRQSAGAAAQQSYTVQPGDSLSKISKQFYGDANKYEPSRKPTRSKTPTKSSPAKNS